MREAVELTAQGIAEGETSVTYWLFFPDQPAELSEDELCERVAPAHAGY
jgi:hypothetical protein